MGINMTLAMAVLLIGILVGIALGVTAATSYVSDRTLELEHELLKLECYYIPSD